MVRYFSGAIFLLQFVLSACGSANNFTTQSSRAVDSSNEGSSITPNPSLNPTPTPTPEPSTNPMPTPSTIPTPTPVPRARASNQPNLVVCPGVSSVNGIDVSDSPNTIWTTARTNVQYGYIKATEGETFTNFYFASYWREAKAAGVLRGAYHYFHPMDDAVTQAEYFLKTMGTLADSDLPPMLDWEVTDNASSAKQVSVALKWLQYVEAKTGRKPVLYTGVSFWNSLGNPQGFEGYPLFISDYQVSCPKVPPPWSNWTIWQRSNNGILPGVQGRVDLDIFNGSLADLSGWLGL